MADFSKAYQLIIANEGGYVNDPDDPGGETYKGIARKYHPEWLGWVIIDEKKRLGKLQKAISESEEKEISNQLEFEVREFYLEEFWVKCRCNFLTNQKVSESIFDFAVNAGIHVSIELAQKVVGVKQDGVNGPLTTAAINTFDPDHFVAAFAVEKIRRYDAIVTKRPISGKYFRGWVRRAVAYILILFFVVSCSNHKSPNPAVIVKTDSVFLKEYVVKKMNEHELRLISITDTVIIYMENTYCFDERIVFIKK
jgi:lysozyme family protein